MIVPNQIQEQQLQLNRSAKLSAIGEMAGGIAHEINNPVNFIHGNVIHLQQHFEDLMELVELKQHAWCLFYQEQNSQTTDMLEKNGSK